MEDAELIKLVGEKISLLRKLKSLTLEDLGAVCDPAMDKQALSRIEGGHNMSISTINRLSKALGVKPHELLEVDSIKKLKKERR